MNIMIIIICLVLCVCCICSGAGGGFYYITYIKDYTLYLPGFTIMNSSIDGSPAIKNVPTIEDCRKTCELNARCQTFSYNTTGRECTLQEPQNVNKQTKPIPTLMGYKLVNNKFTIYDGYSVNDMFVPNIQDPISNVTQEECQKKCLDTNDCVLYKYQYGDESKCYIKKLMKNELLTHGNIDRKNLEK